MRNIEVSIPLETAGIDVPGADAQFQTFVGNACKVRAGVFKTIFQLQCFCTNQVFAMR